MSNKSTAPKENINMQQSSFEIVRKFELAIYNEDVDDYGKVRYNQVSFQQPIIVEAKTPQELNEKLQLYKDAGQVAKVVREIDPPSKETIEKYLKKQQSQTTTVETTENNQQNIQQQTSPQTENVVSNVQVIQQPIQTKQKPKYYKVGDIEIKDDNGKIYQKQWMKLSESEASNIRLINDKNNALVNLTGKHFEMKRWILVETTNDDDSLLEENLK